MTDPKALRLAAIEVLLHRACWCYGGLEKECRHCNAAMDRLAELVGMKTPDHEIHAAK